VYSPAECDALVALASADLVWVDDLSDSGWVMERLTGAVAAANRALFGFDIEDSAESAQIACYGAERQGHFGWHSDIGDGRLAARRKLTIVAQLSPAGAYDGGALEIRPSAQTVTADRAQGSVTLFPSYLLHRVTPVTAGARFSLTLWSHGPGFR